MSSLERIAYALYARFAGIWRSRTFLFLLGLIVGIRNIGKQIDPKADDFLSANILVVRSDVLGDVILTIPFLKALKSKLPHAHITLIVARPWKKFIEQLQIVDEVIEHPLSSNRWHTASNVFKAFAFGLGNLKKRKFDLTLVPRWDTDFNDARLIAFFSNAPQRIAFVENATAWKTVANQGWDCFYTHVISDKEIRHEAVRSLYFLEAIGLGPIPSGHEPGWISISDRIPKTDFKLPPSWVDHQLIGVFPGVQDSKRQWPVEGFIEAAKLIMKNQRVRFLVFGTDKESAQCEQFARGLSGSALNCCGKTALPELAGLVRNCSLVIGCNSGGVHLAGAMDVPVVAIFSHPLGVDPESPVSPERFRLLGKNIVVLQPRESSPASVTAAQVAQASFLLLDQSDP